MTTLAPASRSTTTVPEPPRRRGTLARRQALWCYVFIAPAVLGLLLFSLGPMIASLWLSFTSYDLLSSPEWIGTQNYTDLFSDELFRKSLERHPRLRSGLGPVHHADRPGAGHHAERQDPRPAVLPVRLLPARA